MSITDSIHLPSIIFSDNLLPSHTITPNNHANASIFTNVKAIVNATFEPTKKIHVISTADILAKAIHITFNNDSLSSLFL